MRSQKGDATVQVSNLLTVPQLKAHFLQAAKIDGVEGSQLRTFYGGKEMTDNFSLYQYKVQDDMVVQVMIKN